MDISVIKRKRIVYLVFATATLLVLGLIYAWSIFRVPIGDANPDYKPLLAQVFQVSMFTFCVSALFGAQIFKRVSPRAAIFVAALLLGVGFIVTALCSSFGIWVVFVFYGVFAASGCGIGYNAIISLINPWFPDKTGFCSGVMMMGYGISSLVFGSLANAAFAVIDWTAVFIIIAIVDVAIMSVLAMVVKTAPADIASKLGMQGVAASTKASPTKNQSILKTKTMWLFAIWSTFLVMCGLVLIGSSGQGAAVLGMASFAPLMVGLVSTTNGLSRVINGLIFDRFGLLVVMRLSAVLTILTMAGLAIAYGMNGAGISPVLYVVSGILAAFPYGSLPVMASAFVRQRYNPAVFANNLGIVNCNIGVGAILNIIIAAFLGAPDAGNGAAVFGILAVLAVVALLSTFVFARSFTSDLKQIAKELQ